MQIEKQVSGLSGELANGSVDVPFASGFNLETLMGIDPNPVFATVAIRSGNGNQGGGPYYSPEILRSIEAQINSKRPPGYLGHQDVDKVHYEWREPVTAWVGAKLVPDGEEAKLYVKGYVPPTAPDLRQQLELARAGADVINSVSVFGTRDVDMDRVTRFDLWSLDWTPKGRAGMETELVSVGAEQAKEAMEMDQDEIIRALRVSDLPDKLVGEIQAAVLEEAETEHKPLIDAVNELRVLLDMEEGADPEALVEAVRALVASSKEADLESRFDKELDAQISNTLVREAIRSSVLPKLSSGVTETEIKGEIESALKLPHVAALSTGRMPVVQGAVSEDNARKATRWS